MTRKEISKETLDGILGRYSVCAGHPKQEPLFKLEAFLTWAGYAYFFNFWEDLRPTPFDHDGGDPESINWEKYNFEIRLSRKDDAPIEVESELVIAPSSDITETPLLEIWDFRNDMTVVHPKLSAWDAFDFIEKYFEGD